MDSILINDCYRRIDGKYADSPVVIATFSIENEWRTLVKCAEVLENNEVYQLHSNFFKENYIPLNPLEQFETPNILNNFTKEESYKGHSLSTYFENVEESVFKQHELEILKLSNIDITRDVYFYVPIYKDGRNEAICFIIVREAEKYNFTKEVLTSLSIDLSEEMSISSSQNENSQFSIPDFEDFQNHLHDKIHADLYHIEGMEERFSIILNILDRSEDNHDKELLIYAGADKQRELLEKKDNELSNMEDFDANWNYLKNNYITADMKDIETFKYFNDFRDGELSIESIQIGYLKEYFKELNNPFKENEYPILKHYFNIEEDCFLSIPILQYGIFEGIAHIIFKPKDEPKLNTKEAKIRLCKCFESIYDDLVLYWTLKKVDKQSSVRYQHLKEDAYWETVQDNPIIKDLKLQKHYEISEAVLTKTQDLANSAVRKAKEDKDKIEKQHRHTAVVTILVDSYAHNVSAHSLTATSWWFRGRSLFMGLNVIDADKGRDEDEFRRYRKEEMKYWKSTGNPLLKGDYKTSLSGELYPNFKFLLEKGAFWSGITRELGNGGKTSSIDNILWYDFINNPLYLCSLANTEGINKINIHITFYEPKEDIVNAFLVKRHKRLSGRFVEVDMKNIKKDTAQKAYNKKIAGKYNYKSISRFVNVCDQFGEIAMELKKIHVFFPGGVVGKHSFFTLLENEIRNVKHLSLIEIEKAKDNGLDLHLSFQSVSIMGESNSEMKPLYKIGVWLGHEEELLYDNISVIQAKFNALNGDIMEKDTYRPKLGGSNQDKICAAMLLNNVFSSVQSKTIRPEYYPWIHPATATIEDDSLDFEINTKNEHYLYFSFLYPHKKGILKKYFHLWKGEDIYDVSSEINFSEKDNPLRYKISYIGENLGLKAMLAKQGIIRIMEGKAETDFLSCYMNWLCQWKKEDKNIIFRFQEKLPGFQKKLSDKLLPVGSIYFNEKDKTISVLDTKDEMPLNSIEFNFNAFHSAEFTNNSDLLGYRSHGILMSHIRSASKSLSKLHNIKNDSIFLYEFTECLMTKICMFDKRMHDRIPNEKIALYREYLFCEFYPENIESWKAIQERGFEQFHFLVLHLSFIEKTKNLKGLTYGEKGLKDFIREQIINYVKDKNKLRNFKVVIISGRGRIEWQNSIKGTEYETLITFRAVESLISGIETAMEIHDDFDLKINLTKVLIGS